MWQQVLTATSTLLPIIAYPFLPSTSCGETYCCIVVTNILTFHVPHLTVYVDSLKQTGGNASFLPDFYWFALSWIGYPLAYLKWHTELYGGQVGRYTCQFDEAAEFACWMAMLMVYSLCEVGLGLSQRGPNQDPYNIPQQQLLSLMRLFLAIGVSLVWTVLARGYEQWIKRLIADWLWRFTTRRVCSWRWWFPKAKEERTYYNLDRELEDGEERPEGYVLLEHMWSKRVHKWLRISAFVLVVLQLATLIITEISVK
ncbi:hypothetical protein V8F20_008429 [Naviculisporaceae sp. PSN 640]